jgi:hypothetical protein
VEGVLSDFAPTDIPVVENQTKVAVIDNPGLLADLEMRGLEVRLTRAKMELANDLGDVDRAAQYSIELNSAIQQYAILRQEVNRQDVMAPADGVWVAPELTRRHGKWVGKGDILGLIYSPSDLRLRAVVDQFDAARIFAEPLVRAEFSISGRLDLKSKEGRLFVADLESPPTPAGRRTLFNQALAQQAGGELATTVGNKGEVLTTHHFFELRLLPENGSVTYLHPGQTVLVRLVFDSQPLGQQWFRRFRQFFSSRS